MHGKNRKIQKSLQVLPPIPVEAPIKELATAEKAMSISYFVDTGALESRKIQNMQKPQLTESMEEFMNKNSSKIIEALTFLAVKHAYDNGLPRYVDFKLNADDEAIKMDNIAKIQLQLSEKGAIAMSEDLNKSSGDLLNVINYLLSKINPKEASNVSMFGRLKNNPNSSFSSAMKKADELLKSSDIYTDGMTNEELYEKVYYVMVASRIQLIEFMKLVDKKTMTNSELSNSFKVLIEYASMNADGYDQNDNTVISSNAISQSSRLLLKSILSIYGVDVKINQYKGLIYGNTGWSTGKKVVVGLGALAGSFLLFGALNKQIKEYDEKSHSDKIDDHLKNLFKDFYNSKFLMGKRKINNSIYLF